MTRRLVATGLVSATLYAAILSGAPAPAPGPRRCAGRCGAADRRLEPAVNPRPLSRRRSRRPSRRPSRRRRRSRRSSRRPSRRREPSPRSLQPTEPTVAAHAGRVTRRQPAASPQPTATPRRGPRECAKVRIKAGARQRPTTARRAAPRRRRRRPSRPRRPIRPARAASARTARPRSRPAARVRSPRARARSASRASSSTSSGSRRSCCPIYQAAGMQYGVRWEVLAAINEIETDYGRNLNVSSAGATGWMQFMPATWADYGVDANRDGRKDPYNPVDAIFAAARYLRAAGAGRDIRAGVVRLQPCGLVRRLGAEARAVDRRPAERSRRLAHRARAGPLPDARRGERCSSDARARSRDRRARRRARDRGQRWPDHPDRPVAAARPHVQLRDVYGNTYTYAGLGRLSVRTRRRIRARPRPVFRGSRAAGTWSRRVPRVRADQAAALREPDAPGAAGRSQAQRLRDRRPTRGRRAMPLKKGARVIAGTTLGRLAERTGARRRTCGSRSAPPAAAPRRSTRSRSSTAGSCLSRAAATPASGHNAAFKTNAANLSIGQLMLLSKEALARRVLADPRIEIYDCGQTDIRSGRIDRRVLATMLYLAASGLAPDDLVARVRPRHPHRIRQRVRAQHGHRDGHRGDQRHHHHPGHPGPRLDHGTDDPAAAGPAGSDEAPSDHLADDVRRCRQHAGDGRPRRPHPRRLAAARTGADSRAFEAVLKPSQWTTLIDRLARIDNPEVGERPSP